jgi:hypothetical protein
MMLQKSRHFINNSNKKKEKKDEIFYPLFLRPSPFERVFRPSKITNKGNQTTSL